MSNTPKTNTKINGQMLHGKRLGDETARFFIGFHQTMMSGDHLTSSASVDMKLDMCN
jgi:hypothetical protein